MSDEEYRTISKSQFANCLRHACQNYVRDLLGRYTPEQIHKGAIGGEYVSVWDVGQRLAAINFDNMRDALIEEFTVAFKQQSAVKKPLSLTPSQRH